MLLVKRNPAQRFMGGAWVFPGGAVDADEDHRVAGVREVAEEASVELPDAESLIEFSRWITPPEVKIRFDTRFFLAAAPDGAEAVPDGGETVDLGWYSPPARSRPTSATSSCSCSRPSRRSSSWRRSARRPSCWSGPRGREVVPIEPRVVVEGEVARVVLPGEPGYERVKRDTIAVHAGAARPRAPVAAGRARRQLPHLRLRARGRQPDLGGAGDRDRASSRAAASPSRSRPAWRRSAPCSSRCRSARASSARRSATPACGCCCASARRPGGSSSSRPT